jgi:hypothetical protein
LTRYPAMAARNVVTRGIIKVPDQKYFFRSSRVRCAHSRFPVSYRVPHKQTWHSFPMLNSPRAGDGSHQNPAPHCGQRRRQLTIRRMRSNNISMPARAGRISQPASSIRSEEIVQ